MKDAFYDAIEKRRSQYDLLNQSPISDDRIKEIIEFCLANSPSAFNCQSERVVLLSHESHEKLWDAIIEKLRLVVPENKFGDTLAKLNSFKQAYGTLLFFEDTETITYLETNYKLYAHNFKPWSQQGQGILQYILWTALANEGLGASIQHYTEIIQDEIHEMFDLPKEWQFVAQMPFGAIKTFSEPKDKLDFEVRFKER